MFQELDILSPVFSPLRHHSNSDGDSSSGAELLDGLSNDESDAPLISPSCIPAYDRPPLSKEEGSEERWKTNVLTECFAGWAVAQAGFHRKFIANHSTFQLNIQQVWSCE